MLDKVFEALKNISIRCHSKVIWNDSIDFDLDTVKQALTELKRIRDAKPSEAMDYLYNSKMFNYKGDEEYFIEQHNTIKQALLKAQSQEKENAEYKEVLEILFKKQVDLGWLWYCIYECVNSLNEYNKKMPIEKFKLTEEEFDILKRWCEKCQKRS